MFPLVPWALAVLSVLSRIRSTRAPTPLRPRKSADQRTRPFKRRSREATIAELKHQATLRSHALEPQELRLRSRGGFGAGIASPDGLLRFDGAYYMEVSRKSVHVPVPGFGRETDRSGFYHFAGTSSGIFLKVGLPVMDYTCPQWVLKAKRATTIYLPPTRRFYRWNVDNDSRFVKSIAVLCAWGWCAPSICRTAQFEEWTRNSRIQAPAYWKQDPPNYEHGLTALGFKTAIVFWAGHDTSKLQLRERGPKVLVDYREYNINNESYFVNGTLHMIACQPGHHYHVAQLNGSNPSSMLPCKCEANQPLLNCAQLPASQI